MAKTVKEETNPTYDKIVSKLKEMAVQISHPICVNTYNTEPDYVWISCNYMGTGLKMLISEIDFNDFRNIDPEIMKHCATWTFIDKKKK